MLSPRRNAGCKDGTLGAWAPSLHVRRHLHGDAGEPPSRPSAFVGRGPTTARLLEDAHGQPGRGRFRGGPGSGSCALRTPRLPENRPLKLWWLPPAPAQGGLGAPSAPALDRDYPGLGNVQASEPNRLCQASGLVSLLKTYLGWLVAHAYNLSITERWEIERVTSHWATQEPGAQCSR